MLPVLYEDNHLLVVSKPAGLVTQGAAADEESLVTRARQYLKHKYHKPGNVYLGVVSRLDAAATGVVVLAKTSKAAQRLTELFRGRELQKVYWAVVSGRPQPAANTLRDWLKKDERQQKVVMARPGDADAKEAILAYQTKKGLPHGTWLEIDLQTGRKHQIRVQLAARGWPILGDAKYGSRETFSPGIALHARSLRLVHPVRQEELEFVAPLPTAWQRLGVGNQDV